MSPVPEPRFRVMWERTDKGAKGPMGFAPCTHAEACILMSKCTQYPWRRLFLVKVGA